MFSCRLRLDKIDRPFSRYIGLYGGSFNPPHSGHQHLATYAIKALNLDQLWVFSSPGNPLKCHDELAPMVHRMRALHKSMASNPKIKITNIEEEFQIHKSIDLVKLLKQHYPVHHFIWLMGEDQMIHFHRWAEYDRLISELAIAIFRRPNLKQNACFSKFAQKYAKDRRKTSLQLRHKKSGWSLISMPKKNLSSSQIRQSQTHPWWQAP